MLVFWGLILIVAVMGFFPETAAARWLRRVAVDRPADWLSRLTATKALVWIVAIPVMMVLVVAAPEMLPFLAAMGDAGFALELLLMLWMASVTGGVHGGARRVRQAALTALRLAQRIAAPFRRNASRRRRPAARPPHKSDDSTDAPGVWAFA